MNSIWFLSNMVLNKSFLTSSSKSTCLSETIKYRFDWTLPSAVCCSKLPTLLRKEGSSKSSFIQNATGSSRVFRKSTKLSFTTRISNRSSWRLCWILSNIVCSSMFVAKSSFSLRSLSMNLMKLVGSCQSSSSKTRVTSCLVYFHG